jgi:hypothetical protein
MTSHDLIDCVAHDMTDIASRDDVRAAVLARLDVPRRRRWIHAALPALCAGVAVAWFAGARIADGVQELPRVPQVAKTLSNNPPLRAEPLTLRRTITKRGRDVAPPPISAEEIAWLQRALPVLQPQPALGINPIQPEAIHIAPISVEPIAVTDSSAKAGDRERH